MTRRIKALTLWQPWASFVAWGHKTIETRSWTTDYRGPLAIHASKRTPSMDWPGPFLLTKSRRQVGRIPTPYQMIGAGRDGGSMSVPLGVVVAVVELVAIVPTYRCSPVDHFSYGYGDVPIKGWDIADPSLDDGDDTILISNRNSQLGDYGAGRFAWLFEDIQRFEAPVRARGRQGLWNWEWEGA